jgi:hypothetical protein
MEMGFRKKRKIEKALPPAGPNPTQTAAASPLPRARASPFRPNSRPALARAAARAPPRSLSLTSQPHLPATLSCALPLAGRPTPPVSRVVVFLTYDAPPSPPQPSPRPSPCRTREFGTAPSLPLDRVHAQYRPAVKSHRRRCATFMPVLCTSPAPTELRRSPPLGRL